MYRIGALVVLFWVTPSRVFGAFSVTDEVNCLATHNLYRATVAGSVDHWGKDMDQPCNMKTMLWNRCLAELAQINVDEGRTHHHWGQHQNIIFFIKSLKISISLNKFEHVADAAKKAECAKEFGMAPEDIVIGQNIFWDGNRKYPCEEKCGEAVASWYSEVQYYDKKSGKIAKKFKGSTNSKEVITHFKQLMWANTSWVGCAAGKCPINRLKTSITSKTR